MTEEIKDFLHSMEDRDENGESNALCTVQILKPDDDGVSELKGCAITDGEVSFRIIPRGVSEIMLTFDSNTDYDFLQIDEICREYSDREKDGEDIVLALTLMSRDDTKHFLSALCQGWMYNITDSSELCNGFRFAAETEYMSVVDV